MGANTDNGWIRPTEASFGYETHVDTCIRRSTPLINKKIAAFFTPTLDKLSASSLIYIPNPC
jgi:hypothetical protein